MPDVPLPRRLVCHLGQPAQHIIHSTKQLIQRRRLVQPDIHSALLDLERLQCLHEKLDEIADIHEVSRLLAIAKNGDRQALLRTLSKDADHARIGRGRILAWAVDIEETEDYRFKSMLTPVEIQIVLAGQLVCSIWRQWRFRRVFAYGLALSVIAVYRRTRCKKNPALPAPRIASQRFSVPTRLL